MVNDPIADFLTRIRNGLMARKPEVVTNSSKMLQQIARILERHGYIENFDIEKSSEIKSKLRIKLRYDDTNRPLAEGFKRISKPGLRAYTKASDIPSIRGGMGLAILSTSKGVLTGIEARKQNIGGEVLCTVW
jgi:small subunit ribosomal protein S8